MFCDIHQQRVGLDGAYTRAFQRSLEEMAAQQRATETLLGLVMPGRDKFERPVEIAETRHHQRKAADLLLDLGRHLQAGENTVAAQGISNRGCIQPTEQGWLRLTRGLVFCRQGPMGTTAGHRAGKHEHRQPGRIFLHVRKIGWNSNRHPAKPAAISGDCLKVGGLRCTR
ncbi:hypothetical protein D3C87_1619180 [compost metagenome]